MKKKYIYHIAVLLTGVAVNGYSQDTYETARLLNNDLNGTARYVGMGGALEALGADISTTGTNPAGIGLFRHSTVSTSIGMVAQNDAQSFDGLSKVNASFDQLGFVYSVQTGNTSFFNMALNYHKSRNFDQILSVANSLNGNSLNKITYLKNTLGDVTNGGYYLDKNDKGDFIGWEDKTSDYRACTFSQLDYLNANAVLYDPNTKSFYYSDANAFNFNRAHRGSINNFDINISGNIDDRLYLGLTAGIHQVNYQGYTEYAENIVDLNSKSVGTISYTDERKIEGSGFDLKLGAIVRPFEESAFRAGVYLATPTWYELKTSNHTEINNKANGNNYHGKNGPGYDEYEFKMSTPWMFGVSVGHTFGKSLAVGASYEYTDNSSTDVREYTTYNSYGTQDSKSDRVMNGHIAKSLNGVSTLKAGAEWKPMPSFAVRLGYNYVSPMFKTDATRTTQLDSYGVMYASTADYTNWKDTHRVTAGLGFRTGHVNIDVAYQYAVTDGDFYPFQSKLTYHNGQNIAENTQFSTPTSVSFKRNQLLFTLGYTF